MDYFLWLVAFVAQALIGFLGILAIKSDFAVNHFVGFTIAFVVLTLIALVTSSWGFFRASNSSSALALLTKKVLYEVKGSPDCIFNLYPNFTNSQGGDSDKGLCTFMFFNNSDFPMVDTQIGIVGQRYIECPNYGRSLGDIPAQRGGMLPNFTAVFQKEEEPGWIEFSVDCRSTTMWVTVYFVWNGRGWISDTVVLKEVEGKQIYVRDLGPNSPFEKYVQQEKQWAAENEAAQELDSKG